MNVLFSSAQLTALNSQIHTHSQEDPIPAVIASLTVLCSFTMRSFISNMYAAYAFPSMTPAQTVNTWYTLVTRDLISTGGTARSSEQRCLHKPMMLIQTMACARLPSEAQSTRELILISTKSCDLSSRATTSRTLFNV